MESTDPLPDGGTPSTTRECDLEVRSSLVNGGSSVGVVGRSRVRNEVVEKGGVKKRLRLDDEVPRDCGTVTMKGGMDEASAKSALVSTSFSSSSSLAIQCARTQSLQLNKDIVTAVKERKLVDVKTLIRKGASPESTDDSGFTLLGQICNQFCDSDNPKSKIFSYLISAGAKVDAVKKENGYVALHMAAMSNSGNYVEELLTAGADPNIQDHLGLTALMHAIRFGSTEVATTLVKASSNLSIRDNKGYTALRHAVDWHYGEKDVRQLLEAGADPNTADNKGMTPLMDSATDVRKFEIGMALLEFGANVNSQKSDGETALQIAARCGNKRILMSLIVAGADLNTQDCSGRTALWWAVTHGRHSIVAALLMEGASDNGDEW